MKRIVTNTTFIVLLMFMQSSTVDSDDNTQVDNTNTVTVDPVLAYVNYQKEQLNTLLNSQRSLMTKNIYDKMNSIEIRRFKKRLASLESSHDWTIVNRYGYVGKYQFGSAARKIVGAPKFTASQFKRNPYIWPEKMQEEAVLKLMKINYKILTKYDYNDRNLNTFINASITLKDSSNVTITRAGLLAASHLVGAGSVRKFLYSNGEIDKKDGNGVKCSDYMKHFQNNNLYLYE